MARTTTVADTVINVRLPADLRDSIIKLAERDDRSISYVIRKACQAHVDSISWDPS
jgi:predicted transcriptional regulator